MKRTRGTGRVSHCTFCSIAGCELGFWLARRMLFFPFRCCCVVWMSPFVSRLDGFVFVLSLPLDALTTMGWMHFSTISSADVVKIMHTTAGFSTRCR